MRLIAGGEYIIACAVCEHGERMFWNKFDGWSERADASIYTWDERYGQHGMAEVKLPTDGVWWVIS